MTDIHLLEAGGDIIGLDPRAQFTKALDHALKMHPNARGLVIMGDLTHHGKPEQYRVLKEVLHSFPLPVTFMLGNHDIRENFVDAFPLNPRDENGFVQTTKTFGDTICITLDTKHDYKDEAEKHCGYLCDKRLVWLDKTLQENQDKRALIFMHHPPFDTGFASMDSIKLLNGPAVLNVIRNHPKDTHIFAGHIHRTISGTANGIGFSMFKGTCHQMPMDMMEESTSISVAEPAAYGIICVDETSIIAHTEDFEIAIPSQGPLAGID